MTRNLLHFIPVLLSLFNYGVYTQKQSDIISGWLTSGDAMVSGNDLYLSTNESVVGLSSIWRKEPIHADEFQIEFTFKVNPVTSTKGPLGTQSLGFALWLTQEKPPYKQDNQQLLLGSKPDFHGFGLFFSNFDSRKELNPSISGGFNNGQMWNLFGKMNSTGYYWDYRKSTNMFLKLYFKNSLAIAYVKNEETADYFKLFELKESLPSEIYLSLSSEFTETASKLPEFVDTITISNFKLTFNHLNDINPNESISKKSFVSLPAMEDFSNISDLRNLTTKEKLFVSNEVLYLALQKLAFEIVPSYFHMSYSLDIMENSVYSMFKKFSELYRLFAAAQSPDSEEYKKANNVVNEIIELRRIIQSHAQAFHEVTRVEELIKPIENYGNKKIDIIDRSLYRQHRTNWILFIFFISTLTLIGLFIWKKATDLEKKHMY